LRFSPWKFHSLREAQPTLEHPREVAARVREWSAVASAGLPVPVERWLAQTNDQSNLQRGVTCVLRVARESGAPLAGVLQRLAIACDRTAENADQIEQSLAGPRMARRIIWALPLLAVPLNALMGFDVMTVLLSSPIGWILSAIATALTLAGSRWSTAMIVRAQRIAPAPGLYPRLLSVALESGVGLSRASEIVTRILVETDAIKLLDSAELRECDQAITRSRDSGIPIRGLLLALDARAVERTIHASNVRARELGEKLLIPLALCTLPAFLCLGVVPAIIAVVSGTRLGF
jgi:tight adherence protein B